MVFHFKIEVDNSNWRVKIFGPALFVPDFVEAIFYCFCDEINAFFINILDTQKIYVDCSQRKISSRVIPKCYFLKSAIFSKQFDSETLETTKQKCHLLIA